MNTFYPNIKKTQFANIFNKSEHHLKFIFPKSPIKGIY